MSNVLKSDCSVNAHFVFYPIERLQQLGRIFSSIFLHTFYSFVILSAQDAEYILNWTKHYVQHLFVVGSFLGD